MGEKSRSRCGQVPELPNDSQRTGGVIESSGRAYKCKRIVQTLFEEKGVVCSFRFNFPPYDYCAGWIQEGFEGGHTPIRA